VIEERGTSGSARGRWTFVAGDLARDGWETIVDASIKGWRWTGLRVANLGPGDKRTLPASPTERLVVPLAGSFSVSYRERGKPLATRDLEGRESVFKGPSDVLYLGAFCEAEIGGSGRVAVAEAPTPEALPAIYVPRESIKIELRGSGRNSRQVHNFGTPANLAASRFMVVEVITPAMNWSSFPPHKHDRDLPGVETALEEIYYFETATSRGLEPRPGADPIGFMRAYSSKDRELDYMVPVRTGDVCLCPYAYHGPSIASPGCDLYFLNVMAGPSGRRDWLVCEDPAHAWVRDTFQADDFDPRLPYMRGR
jgi:5-deoxy-glucuronate isomerase